MQITIYNNQNIGVEINSANARELHAFLNSEQQYADWIKNRISQYGFTLNQDYIVKTIYTGRRPRKEYFITLDMAKELCMVENNEKGKQARRYFIECEKELTRLKAIEQSNRISSLQMQLATDKKHQLNQINGYKSQIKKHNEQIKLLKAKLTIAEDKAKNLSSNDELLKRLEWLFKRCLSDGVIYAINSSRDKIINDALKKANDEFMGNLHLLKEN